MATVYKVELILTSHWMSYNEKDIKEKIERHLTNSLIEDERNYNNNEISIRDIKIKKDIV
jgi:hypothetical protein